MRDRIEDITKLETGQVIQVNNNSGRSERMTVKITFDQPKEGRFAVMAPGVQCTVHANAHVPAHDTLITPGLLEVAVIHLLSPSEAKFAADVDTALTDLEQGHIKGLMEE